MVQNLGKPLENSQKWALCSLCPLIWFTDEALCNENVSAGITDGWMCRLDVHAADARPASEFGLVSRSR